MKKKREKSGIQYGSPKRNNENKNTELLPRHVGNSRDVLRQTNNSKTMKGELEKTFVNLKEIKTNKPKKSNLQMKQVLVSGDEIDYYATHKAFSHLNFIGTMKASYFLSRGFKL